MLKLKMKGKHIVAVALIILISAGLLYIQGPNLLYKRADALSSQGKSEEANAYYELTTKLFPYSDEGIRALFFSAQQDISNTGKTPGLIIILPTSTSTEYASAEITKQAIDKFNLVRLRAPKSPWAKHALRELGSAYYSLGDTENAIKYLEMSLEESKMRQVESTELLARIFLEQGDAEKALELVEKSLKEQPNQLPLDMMLLKGRAQMALGKWNEAYQVFKEIPEKAQSLYNRIIEDEGAKNINSNIEHWENVSQGYIKKLESLSENKGLLGSISGKVYLGDTGIEGSYVYLVDLAINQDNYTGSSHELTKTKTDHEGRFIFSGLVPGRYELGVGIVPEKAQGHVLQKENATTLQVNANESLIQHLQFVPIIKVNSPAAGIELEDEIIFNWEAIKGADSYSVFVGPITRDETGKITGTYTTNLRSDIKTNELAINIDQEITSSRFRQSIAYHHGEISPLSLLGMIYYSGEYTWGVNAYDKEGKFLTSSTGYGFHLPFKELPLFKISDKKLSTGDKLILDKKYEAAKKAFLQQLEDNPQDKHALLMLARMNHFGTEIGNRDLEAAIGYYEQLFEVDATSQTKKALADIYYEAGHLNQAYAVYKSLLNTSEENWQIHFRMARIMFGQGETEQSLSILRQTVQMENGIYVRTYPVAISLLLNDMQGALWFAQKVDQGDTYLDLIKTYQLKGFEVNPEVQDVISVGNYNQALDMLSNTQQDSFIKGLLYFTISKGNYREEVTHILVDMEPGLQKELLQKLTI
ncbi:MAG: hypothetical protein CVU87_03985 [Firmicutes bacterium HGW-Firmicutes-12]|nr:MAG: hypothetical protein CVU87_03985 [Firmicutes bacterium HGW-Firmicutes-12]